MGALPASESPTPSRYTVYDPMSCRTGAEPDRYAVGPDAHARACDLARRSGLRVEVYDADKHRSWWIDAQGRLYATRGGTL